MEFELTKKSSHRNGASFVIYSVNDVKNLTTTEACNPTGGFHEVALSRFERSIESRS